MLQFELTPITDIRASRMHRSFFFTFDFMAKSFSFWCKYLQAISLFFMLMGLLWMLIGSFDPFGIYDQKLAQHFFNVDELPDDAAKTFAFALGPFGATAAGYFLMQYFIIRFGFPTKQMWTFNAVLAALTLWFVSDTIFSMYHGAYFNVAMANVSTIVFMSPLFFLRKHFTKS